MNNELFIREILMRWASATREGKQEEILAHHAPDVTIYDVLPPMKYASAAAYRQSWDEWQPATQGEAIFDWQELTISAGSDLAFAHGFIRCGGTLQNGKTFEDTVRATFCLQKQNDYWLITHQHISKPFSVHKQ